MPVQIINTHEAKSRLSELIRDAEAGVEVIVARGGHPVAKIIPWPPPRPLRTPGAWADRVAYLDDVVEPDPDIAEVFAESAGADLP